MCFGPNPERVRIGGDTLIPIRLCKGRVRLRRLKTKAKSSQMANGRRGTPSATNPSASLARVPRRFGLGVFVMRLAAIAFLLVLGMTGAAFADFQGLLHHARTKNLEGVRTLLEQGADPNPPNAWYAGYTPLMFAAGNGDVEMTRLLLEADAATELRDHNGERALEWASRAYYLHSFADVPGSVRLLLQAGSPPDSDGDRLGMSPLMHASQYGGHPGIIRLLLDAGADPNRVDTFNETALHRAAWQDGEAVGLLLAAGANPNVSSATLGGTPLHRAADGSAEANARLLLQAGAETEPRYYRGRTALFIAASNRAVGVVDALLEAGAALDAADDDGMTPVLAALAGRSETVVRDRAATALVLAAHTADIDRAFAAALWQGEPAVAAILADRGAQVGARDHRGRSALAGTSELSGMGWFERLVERVDLDAHGAETLHAAAARGRHPMIRRLLEKGVAVDARAGGGATALMHAAATGRVGTVSVLLEQGANPLSSDDEGRGAEAWMALGREELEAAITHATESRAWIDVSSERRQLARLVAAQEQIRKLLGL